MYVNERSFELLLSYNYDKHKCWDRCFLALNEYRHVLLSDKEKMILQSKKTKNELLKIEKIENVIN